MTYTHTHPRNSFATNELNRMRTNARQRVACITPFADHLGEKDIHFREV